MSDYFSALKNVFSLSAHDGDINVNIDNVFPLMKALELDTKDETILDMIHEACIESKHIVNKQIYIQSNLSYVTFQENIQIRSHKTGGCLIQV